MISKVVKVELSLCLTKYNIKPYPLLN